MAIGEAGSVVASVQNIGDSVTITLTEPLDDPVFALTGTSNNPDPYSLRIIDQTVNADGQTTAFTFIIEEWEYLDGFHGPETINWLAIEKGVHELPDGRTVEAGTTQVSSARRNTGEDETFAAMFTEAPIVLTSVMSNNDTTTIDSDPQNITASGFRITLQEEERQDGNHAAETIGWIAVEPGGDQASGVGYTIGNVTHSPITTNLGVTFGNAIILTDTQDIRGGDTSREAISSQTNNSVDLFTQEEQSRDSEVNHTRETFAVVAFEGGLIQCFTAGTRIETPTGNRKIDNIRVGDALQTIDNGPQIVRWKGKRKLGRDELRKNPRLYPVRISAGALGNGLPKKDLVVSQQHRMHLTSRTAKRMFGHDEVLIAAIRLTEIPGIYVDTDISEIEYNHLLFDNHEIVVAEGCKTESLYLGQEAKKALSTEGLSEIQAIFPDLTTDRHIHVEARHIPRSNQQVKFVARHYRNKRQ